MVLNIFTIVNIKKGPTITDSASYSMSSCPFSIVIAIPEWFNDFSYTNNMSHNIGWLGLVFLQGYHDLMFRFLSYLITIPLNSFLTLNFTTKNSPSALKDCNAKSRKLKKLLLHTFSQRMFCLPCKVPKNSITANKEFFK